MGDRLLGFPIKNFKYRHCYNIGTDRRGSLQVLRASNRPDATLVSRYHILCYNHA
jgi:hypothetical protein